MNIKTFIDRPVLSCVLSVFIVLLGVIGLSRLPMEQFPEIAPPTVRVSATYTGANAETLQRSVIAPLEEAINGVEGINYMTSSANNNGQATVTIYFRQGTDPDMAAVNVQNRIAQAQGLLPAEVVQSGVNVRKSQNSTAKIVALYSPDDRYDQKFIFNYFKINIEPRLARVPGVGDITLFGSDYSLRIWLNPDKMAVHGLVPADIEAVLAEQNIEIPTGTLGADGENTFQYALKYRGRYETEDEFRQLVVKSTPDGGILRLGEVADIELGQLSYSVKNELSGHPGTNCMIAQMPGSNANELVEKIDEVIKAASEDLPDGLVLVDLMSVKSFMDASIANVLHTLIEAIVLVILVVMLFIQNFRSSLIPGIAIVVSLVGTLAFLYFAGFSLNMLTLFALVLVIGTVVDDAIVVVEAVQSQFDGGERSPYQATVKGMKGITRPIVTTSLVFMAVFIPVCFIEGATGIFYRQFGLTMAVAVLISTFNALTLSPALCVLIMKPVDKTARFTKAFNAAFNVMGAKYTSSLSIFFRHKWIVAGLIVTSIAAFVLLLHTTKTGLVPDEDTGTVVVDIQAAPGTSRARTEQIMAEVESKISDIPQFQIYSKSIGMGMLGGQGASNGTFIIRLKPWEHIIRKTKRATLIERKVRKLKRNVLFSQNEAYHRCAFLSPVDLPFSKKFRPGFAGFCGPAPGSPQPRPVCIFERPPNIIRRPFFSCYRFTLWVAARPLSRSRDLGHRFVRGHALRFDEVAAEGQARPDIRERIRSIVIRIRERHAAMRIRVAVAAIDHTAYTGGDILNVSIIGRRTSHECACWHHVHIQAMPYAGYP